MTLSTLNNKQPIAMSIQRLSNDRFYNSLLADSTSKHLKTPSNVRNIFINNTNIKKNSIYMKRLLILKQTFL